MNKKKIMATSLTALTLLSTGAITTYVANNVIVEAESNTNTKVQKTIWLLDNRLVKELSGDHKAEELDLTEKNAKLDRTEIQGSIRLHHFVTKTTTNTTNPVTPPVSNSSTATTVKYTSWVLKNEKGITLDSLAETKSGDLDSKKELEAKYEYVGVEKQGEYKVHVYRMKTSTTSSDSTTTTSTTTSATKKYEWTTKDGRKYLKVDGKAASGWTTVDGKKYFFLADGSAKVGILDEGGKRFYFDAEGVQKLNWQKVGDKYYYFKEDGTILKGIFTVGDKKYYLEDGVQVVGLKKVENKWYFFTEDGVNKTGLIKDGEKY